VTASYVEAATMELGDEVPEPNTAMGIGARLAGIRMALVDVSAVVLDKAMLINDGASAVTRIMSASDDGVRAELAELIEYALSTVRTNGWR
jgi:hypothetical protein